MELQKIYNVGIKQHHYANTAYPLHPNSFKEYKVVNSDDIRQHIADNLNSITNLGLYVHLPFCEKRCKFCEYTVLADNKVAEQTAYVDSLLREIRMYSEFNFEGKITGVDIGGGTPTVLSVENLKKISDVLFQYFPLQNQQTHSIETTPKIAAHELEKLKSVRAMGWQRISMGVQSISSNLLRSFDREGTIQMIQQAVDNIREAGFLKLNIDLMYGFLHQQLNDFKETITFSIALAPEYITLYRNRYKGTKLEHEAKSLALHTVNEQYDLAFRMLNEAGYKANIGKNTFSRVERDFGTSDYLTHRVIGGTPYIGMGLGAQSFGNNFLAYNDGAANKRTTRYLSRIAANDLPIQDFYLLPQAEQMAKMISVAFYFGYIDTEAFQKRFHLNFSDVYATQIIFLQEQKLMQYKGRLFELTKLGNENINGIIPLFHSERSQQELLKM